MSKAVPATLYQTFVKYQNQMAQANGNLLQKDMALYVIINLK